MVHFSNPNDLLSYLESNKSSYVKFNKIRIRKDAGFVSISTDSEELSLSLELNSDQDQLFSAEDIVKLIVSLPK